LRASEGIKKTRQKSGNCTSSGAAKNDLMPADATIPTVKAHQLPYVLGQMMEDCQEARCKLNVSNQFRTILKILDSY
jgi:hypothetical protein